MKYPHDYQIEADFDLLSTCNFRCSYCFVPLEQLGAKIVRFATNLEWQRAFDGSGKTWLIHITGGEPFVYPEFVNLCDLLTRRHYLSINSNLAHRSVDDFAATIDPAKVHFINASLHYTERQAKGGLDSFVRRIHKLQDAHFPVFVSLVMTPEMIRLFDQIASDLESNAVFVIPKIMYGAYKGRLYPRSYSSEERLMLRRSLSKAAMHYTPTLSTLAERPTIDMFADDDLLDGNDDFTGRLCGSGHSFVAINKDGTLVRCGSGQHLGNLLTGDLQLLSRPVPCDSAYCHYFCRKFTAAPFAAESEGDHKSDAAPARMLPVIP